MENCTVCAECDDSPLSISSSVFGILTGVLALLAAVYVRFRLVRRAAMELAQIEAETISRMEIFDAKVRRVERMQDAPPNPLLQKSARRLATSIMEVRDLTERFKVTWRPRSNMRFLGIGIKYMILRDQLKESVDKMIASNDILNDAFEVRCVRNNLPQSLLA